MINKRACASYRVEVSVEQVKRYKETIKQDCKGTDEYCEARIALDHAIPEWLHHKAWTIAKEVLFMEQILTATDHEWYEALDAINRNLAHMKEVQE